MQKVLSLIKDNQKMLIDFSVAAVCLLLFSLFPASNFFQNLTKSLFFLVLIPYLYIKYILKKNFSDFGFNIGEKRKGFILAGMALIFSLLIIYFLANFTDFKKYYTIPTDVSKNFYFFIFYELVLVNILFVIQEYFFKGFMISIFRKKLGYLSVLIQAIIYVIPLWIFFGSAWQTIPLVIVSLIGGAVAYKSRTFFYSYISGMIFIILTDAYMIYVQK